MLTGICGSETDLLWSNISLSPPTQAPEDNAMDLIVRNARLADRLAEGPLDIAVADGRIAAIGKELGVAAEGYDAGGRLVCAGMIETHIHLDKSRIIDRCPPPQGRRVNPVTMTAPL